MSFHGLLAVFAVASLAAAQALEDGKRAFDAGKYAVAARLFEKAREESGRCDASFYLGLARYRLKQADAALIAFQEAVQCDPQLTAAHLALAEAYAQRRNYRESLAAYTRVLSLEPTNTAALRGAASIYLQNQTNEEALPLLEALVKAEPNDPQARVGLAAVYAATGSRDGAELQFREALRLKPNSPSALLGLGNLYLKRGEETKAIPLLQRAIQIVPQAFEPRFLLGSAYNRLGRYEQALTQLLAALRRGGDDSTEVHYHLARAYGGLGRQQERQKALARFAKLTEKEKKDTESQRASLRLAEQASTLVKAGDLHGAVARMEEARELSPADDRILFRLASLHFDLQQYDLARNYAQEAISLAPSVWLYHYLLGLIEKSSGRLPQARKSLETAGRLNPSAAEVQQALEELRD